MLTAQRIDTRTLTAYHEAGHAAVGLDFGLRILKVSIRRRPKTLGRCEWNGWSQLPPHAKIITASAGWLAEEIAFGPQRIPSNDPDTKQCREAAALLCRGNGEIETIVNQWKRRSRALLDQPRLWIMVEVLANALLERTELSGEEAHRLLVQNADWL